VLARLLSAGSASNYLHQASSTMLEEDVNPENASRFALSASSLNVSMQLGCPTHGWWFLRVTK
jgi:replication-associated recombination protein RarA